MGVPGPVDRAHGTAGSATILPGWVGLRIASEMEQRLGVPVQIENDANLGALAELTWGAGRDCSNFAYIKAATGIGAGIVIDGRFPRGATGTAGEIGPATRAQTAAAVDVRPAVFVERAELLGSVALALLGSHEAEIARARSNSAPLAPARLLNRAD